MIALTESLMSAMPHLSSAEAMGLTLFIACLFLWAVGEVWLELGSNVMAVMFAASDCEEIETPESVVGQEQ